MTKEGKKEKRTGGNGTKKPGRPPGPPLSEAEKKKKTKEKNVKYKGRVKLECEVYKAFCEMPVIVDMFKAFSEEYMRRINAVG